MPITYTRSTSVFRVIAGKFPPYNIYGAQAKRTFSLAALMVATVTKEWCQRIDAEAMDENNWRPIRRRAPISKDGMPDHQAVQIERYADFIGISCAMSTAAPRCLELVRIYSRMPENLRPRAIIVGGWHAIDNAREFLEVGADVVIQGEVEMVIVQLMDALRNGTSLAGIQGISYRDKDGTIHLVAGETPVVPQEKMDELPLPNFGLCRYAVIKYYPVQRIRGCSGKCRFCRVKCAPRWMSAQRFLELLVVLASQGVKHIFITDDRIEEDMDGLRWWLEEFAKIRLQRKLRVTFIIQSRLSTAQHPEVLNLMWQAGVRTVCIGFEDPREEAIASMRKPLSVRKIDELVKVWKMFGFYMHMMGIFLYPLRPNVIEKYGREILVSAKKLAQIFRNYIKRVGPDTLQILILTPLSNTEDREFLESQGRIFHQFDWDKYDGTFLLFKPDENIDPVEGQEESIKLMRCFYGYPLVWRWPLFDWPIILTRGLLFLLFHLTMPFLWLMMMPIKLHPARAWDLPRKIRRNLLKKLGAMYLIHKWYKYYKKIDFAGQLRQAASKQ